MKVDLGDGKFAVLRELDEVTAGDRKKLWMAWDKAFLIPDKLTGKLSDPGGGGNIRTLVAVDEAIALTVTSWDLDESIPSLDPSVLDRLPIKVHNKLARAVDPYVKELRLNFDPDPSPEAPTSPSRTTEPS